MASVGVLSAAVNVSEGRRGEVISAIAEAAARHAPLLDTHSDPDHNRTVLTLSGPPGALVDAVLALAGKAVELIDLKRHEGVHPRLGAVDVVPFTPRLGTSMEVAEIAAHSCAGRLWGELAVPCFLYERSAASQERSSLPSIRRNAFRSMLPDLGGPLPTRPPERRWWGLEGPWWRSTSIFEAGTLPLPAPSRRRCGGLPRSGRSACCCRTGAAFKCR